jgi:hypothetical protein
MKKIWESIKKYWPIAKMFICMTRDEAVELDSWADYQEIDFPDTNRPAAPPYPKILKDIKAKLRS